jgi:hypothetical protein
MASYNIYVGATNATNTAVHPTAGQIAAASIGGGLTATDNTYFYNRLLTYMMAVGAHLVLHYKFDDTTTTDSSGYSNTGTLTGSGTTLVTGHIGSALSFTGSGYVTFTSVSSLGLATATSEISVACWIKTTSLDPTFLSLRDGGSAIIDLVAGYNGVGNANTGIPSFLILGTNGVGLTYITGSTSISDNNWHHIAATRTSGKLLTLYIDGVSVASGTDTLTSGVAPTVAGSAVGYEIVAGGRGMVGLIDDFRIYNRADFH